MPRSIDFYADEHVSRAVVRALRLRGVGAQTVHEAGLAGAEDREHLAHAAATARVLVTQDADFLRLHAGGVPHAGIAFAPQGTPIRQIVRGLLEIFNFLDGQDMVGQIEFL